MQKSYVVALDGSDCAWSAFDVALQLAWIGGARLLACTVADPHRLEGEYPQSSSAMGALLAQVRVDAREIVLQSSRIAQEHGVKCETAVLFADSPADAIVSMAQEHRALAIVLGTHGRKGLAHAFLGSVAERVLRSADCGVITVKPANR